MDEHWNSPPQNCVLFDGIPNFYPKKTPHFWCRTSRHRRPSSVGAARVVGDEWRKRGRRWGNGSSSYISGFVTWRTIFIFSCSLCLLLPKCKSCFFLIFSRFFVAVRLFSIVFPLFFHGFPCVFPRVFEATPTWRCGARSKTSPTSASCAATSPSRRPWASSKWRRRTGSTTSSSGHNNRPKRSEVMPDAKIGWKVHGDFGHGILMGFWPWDFGHGIYGKMGFWPWDWRFLTVWDFHFPTSG